MTVAWHTPSLAAGDDPEGRARSLVLAGGGVRVAWQAGVLRALEEAGLRFGHADGTSGGTLNLAMLLSGLSPDEMCERWRELRVRDFVSLPPLGRTLVDGVEALGSATGLTERVFPALGIDAARIRAARGIVGTFNACDYGRKVNEAVVHESADEDLLVACVSLPMLMPPVRRPGGAYLDSVWIKDANLTEGVRRGSREQWLLWCIGNSGVYRSGLFHQYVHMIELSANGALFEELDRITELNRRIAAGEAPDGRTEPVRLHVIRPEAPLPLDSDLMLGRIDTRTLIAIGYRDASRYLESLDPGGVALDPGATRMRDPRPGLGLRACLRGPLDVSGTPGMLELSLSVEVEDLDRLLVDPAAGAALLGDVTHPALGRRVLLRGGELRLSRGGGLEGAASFRSGGREWRLGLARARGGLEPTAQVTVGEPGGTGEGRCEVRMGRRDLAALAGSLHARGVGSLGEGAGALARFAGFLVQTVRAGRTGPPRRSAGGPHSPAEGSSTP